MQEIEGGEVSWIPYRTDIDGTRKADAVDYQNGLPADGINLGGKRTELRPSGRLCAICERHKCRTSAHSTGNTKFTREVTKSFDAGRKRTKHALA
jgi:hypothetical protein